MLNALIHNTFQVMGGDEGKLQYLSAPIQPILINVHICNYNCYDEMINFNNNDHTLFLPKVLPT